MSPVEDLDTLLDANGVLALYGSGLQEWLVDELEMGERVAFAFDDEELRSYLIRRKTEGLAWDLP